MVWDGGERRGQERRCDNLSERVAVLESELAGVKDGNAAILRSLQKIHTELTRYKGFVGGVVFVVTCVVTVVGYLWQGVASR